jgi:hypothetical protein
MAWQEQVRLWDPNEIETASTGSFGLTAKDTAQQMKKKRDEMMRASSGFDPYETAENQKYNMEHSLMQREADRRDRDSEAAVAMQSKKYSVLGGLLGGNSRVFGDRPKSWG